MLRDVPDGLALVVCNSCKGGGAHFAQLLRAEQSVYPRAEAITVEEMPCLFACSRGCTVHLRGPGRIGYVMGDFTPDRAAARALLDYAIHYAASDDGQVPYRLWPEGVKGHFIVRIPPPGKVVT